MAIRFPFPKQNPNLETIFNNDLCKALPPEDLPGIRKRFENRLSELQQEQDDLLGPNIQMAKEIVDCFNELFSQYPSLNYESQGLVMGAVNYFLAKKDLIHDGTPVTGFDDDARILNHILERIGLEDLYIDLP